MTKAEERLARAEALLVHVQSSVEALHGQKVVVDQAVEKAGSLRGLLKQAEAMLEGLKEERELMTRVRAAVAVVRQGDDADGDEEMAKAA
jgi:rubrerythrin